jgi:hypothetical protein
MAAETKSPAKAGLGEVTGKGAASRDVDAFLADVRARVPAASGARGRLIFAMDATMSRQPTWDMALGQQASMFEAVREVGGLDVQLVFFRGFNECRSSRWVSDPAALAKLMTQVQVRGGHTQIRKVLSHARREAEAAPVHALVYVGDAMEENVDELAARAGELGLLNVPCFMFQEGGDGRAETAFREIARLTRGAWCRFDQGSARQLRDLLRAVAVFATGGHAALSDLSKKDQAARGLLEQFK